MSCESYPTWVAEDSKKSAQSAIERLLKEQNESAAERRSAVRTPFFHPITIEVDGRSHSGFTRDLSPPGIGLLHCMPLEAGEIVVHLPLQDRTLKQRTLIVWCRDVGEGWYASGGRFLDAYNAPDGDGES